MNEQRAGQRRLRRDDSGRDGIDLLGERPLALGLVDVGDRGGVDDYVGPRGADDGGEAVGPREISLVSAGCQQLVIAKRRVKLVADLSGPAEQQDPDGQLNSERFGAAASRSESIAPARGQVIARRGSRALTVRSDSG